jgi:hypothetical protein
LPMLGVPRAARGRSLPHLRLHLCHDPGRACRTATETISCCRRQDLRPGRFFPIPPPSASSL